MIGKLHAILNDLAVRRQRQRLHAGLSLVWWLGTFIGLLLWKYGVPARAFLPFLAAGLVLASIGVFIWSRRGKGDPRHIAKDIEHKHPALQTALLAALDQQPDSSSGSLSFLQNRLILDSLATAERDRWLEIVPRPRLTALRLLHLAGAFLFLLIASILLLPRVAKPQAVVVKKTAVIVGMAVDPGDVEIERGSPLTIQVRFDGNPPPEATLETTGESGTESIPLTRPFTDPIYQTRLVSVNEPMTYRVIVPEGASRTYTVSLYEIPSLRESEVVLNFPEHLGKAPETIKDPHTIQVVEGTRMDLTLVANLPDISASLVAKKRDPLKLTPSPADPLRHKISETLTGSVRYEIVLTDKAGRRNPGKDFLDIKVLPNKAPVVQVLLPRKGDKVTPIQEVRLEARIIDDSGILAHGLRYTLDGETWQEFEGAPASGEKRPILSQLVDLEAAGAKPNDILMWNAWAEDIGPDGKKRRVTGDIHLVQVRNFDEEFYQQSAPPGEAPPPGDNLVKLQTKILDATWNLRRDHAEITNTPPPAKELETLHGSQETAVEMAAALEEEITDPAVRSFVTDARLAMIDASAKLAEAHEKTSAEPLEPAIAHEQTALRHLYQLMGSKTMLVQSESKSSAPSEDTPKEDLDLKPMENPYKDEKSAKPELAQEANEAMEILKRLDELAKRQRDINEEMKALQMALNQADTPEKKAEIERRLKQLRDQQKDLLADVDKLEQKASEATVQDQKQTLEEAREKAQQAKQQLDELKLGDALASGRRAQESLEKLHDDFRETSAAKLAQQLGELREDARALEKRQRDLSANAPPEAPKPTRLSDKGSEQPEIARQREDFQKLTDALRETAETAEKTEPLVAKDLGEALRQADQNGISKALDRIGERGDEQAATQASEGISKLTREIENAAERILGNEEQALRYARDEIARLAEQAGTKPGEEPGQADGNSPKPGEGKEPGEGKGQTAQNSQKPGHAPGQAPGEGKQPGQAEGKAPGEGEGQTAQNSDQPGQSPGQGKAPGEGKGQSPGEGQGEGQGKGQTAGQSPGRGQSPGQGAGQGAGGSRGGAISGEGYEEWRDRLADLEAVITDPEAQSAVARARKAGQEMRKDLKRHSKAPDQARIDAEILQPLAEAAKELDVRLRELDREDPLAPVGRDPVPDRYAEIVRRYFEELGNPSPP